MSSLEGNLILDPVLVLSFIAGKALVQLADVPSIIRFVAENSKRAGNVHGPTFAIIIFDRQSVFDLTIVMVKRNDGDLVMTEFRRLGDGTRYACSDLVDRRFRQLSFPIQEFGALCSGDAELSVTSVRP